MSRNYADENDVPHIQAECANCHFVFDLKFGTDCPKCHHVGVKWARLVTEEEAKQYGDAARRQLRIALDRITEWEERDPRIRFSVTECNWSVDSEEQRSIDECEKIFALDSTGSRP